MTESNFPKWVPASLVRVRCFLNRRGMKVKPWLGPEAVLDAFYAALRLQTHNDDFWTELEQLLADLASDMNERIQSRGWVIENELLDSRSHAELLAQIRQALGIEASACAGLHPLATAIPRRAGALLLMLAAAIVVGCGGEVDAPTGHGASGGGAGIGAAASTSGGASSVGASGGTTAQSIAQGSGGFPTLTLAASGGTTSQSTGVCPSPDASSRIDPAAFAACNPKLVAALIPYAIEGNLYNQLLECACLLNEAWQTGLGDLFAGKDCNEIISYFGDCGMANLCGNGRRPLPASFDADALFDRCMVLLYLGVRCD
ncbi:MAG TPA: hypothetical protein VIV60_04850 [Polyangiaceae bacterium]